MPARASIFFKLNLFFLLALLTLTLLFALFRMTAGHMEERREVLRGMELGRLLHQTRFIKDEERTAALSDAQFTPLVPGALPAGARELQPPRNQHGEGPKPFFRLYEQGGIYYFRSRAGRDPFLVRDDRPSESFAGIHLVFVLLLAGLVTLYVLLRRSLLPLRDLHAQIRRFAQGELEIDTSSTRRDEIAAIANEFNDALGQLRRLRASRQLFLRNVMHELKTPLTKGKLALAMMKPDEQTGYLDRLFTRMDELINRLAEIEKLESTRLHRHPCALPDLIDKAIAQLYIDRPREALFRVNMEAKPTVNVDEKLFVSALANLLDNALKYADALPVTLTVSSAELCISNSGAAMENDIATYLQPFAGSGRNGGFGLGLSIADTVVRSHGFTLVYSYEAPMHRFCIRFAEGRA